MNSDTEAYRALAVASLLRDKLGARSIDYQLVYLRRALEFVDSESASATTLRSAIQSLEQMQLDYADRVVSIVDAAVEMFDSTGVTITGMTLELDGYL